MGLEWILRLFAHYQKNVSLFPSSVLTLYQKFVLQEDEVWRLHFLWPGKFGLCT